MQITCWTSRRIYRCGPSDSGSLKAHCLGVKRLRASEVRHPGRSIYALSSGRHQRDSLMKRTRMPGADKKLFSPQASLWVKGVLCCSSGSSQTSNSAYSALLWSDSPTATAN